jgi:hypothetical protein
MGFTPRCHSVLSGGENIKATSTQLAMSLGGYGRLRSYPADNELNKFLSLQ